MSFKLLLLQGSLVAVAGGWFLRERPNYAGEGSEPVPVTLLMNKTSLESYPAAQCNDASPAAYYYSNCTANWDSKPGTV